MKILRTFSRHGQTFFAGKEYDDNLLPERVIPLLVRDGWIVTESPEISVQTEIKPEKVIRRKKK